MRVLIVWISFLVVIGVAVSVFLIPTKEDIALYNLKQEQYTEAENYYLEQYLKGNRSQDVVIELSKVEEQQGHLDDAINVMKGYVKTHPNDFLALKRLGELYRSNQQYDDYFQILLQLKRRGRADVEVLQQLVAWYKSSPVKKVSEVRPFEAENYYLDLYFEERHLNEVNNQLHRLDVEERELDDAIALMQGYVNAHPEDFLALRQLQDLYLSNYRSEHYLKSIRRLNKKMLINIENLQKVSAFSKNLREQRQKKERYLEAENYYLDIYYEKKRLEQVYLQLQALEQEEWKLNYVIDLMSAYVKTHPEDFLAFLQLQNLYQSNLRHEDYLRTLLHIQFQKQDKTNFDTLREVPDWKGTQEQNLINVLQELVKTGRAEGDDYLDLATLYAARKDYARADALLQTRRVYFPKEVQINDLLFEVWILVQLSKAQGNDRTMQTKAVNLLSDYLLKLNNSQVVYYAVGFFKEHYPLLLTSLVDQVQPLLKNDPNLEIKVLQVLWEIPGEKEQVFPELLKLYQTQPQNPQIQNWAFNVFVEKGQDQHLLELLQRFKGTNIEERSVISLALTIIQNGNASLAKEIQKALGKSYLKKHPLVAIALEIGTQDPDVQSRVNAFIKRKNLTQSDWYYLLQLTAAAHLTKEALESGAHLPPYAGLDDYQMVDIASAYVQIHKAKELYKLIEQSQHVIGTQQANYALLVLDVALHRPKRVAARLQGQKEVPESLLSAVYTAAEDSKEYPLALYAAKRWIQDYSSPYAEANYALALVQVGKIETGIAILRELNKKMPTNALFQKNYFTALSLAVKQDKRYKIELAAYMKSKENQGKLSPATMRDFAYTYLDIMHNYAKAEAMFQQLSNAVAPSSEEVKTLFYLWGPNLSKERTEWVNKKAGESTSQEFGSWLQYLVFIGEFGKAIELFNKHGAEELDSSAYFSYLEALVYEKDNDQLRDALYLALEKMEKREELERLATYAEEAQFYEGRRVIWEEIVCRWPEDPLSWQGLARAAFDQHDYDRTFCALLTFFRLARHAKPNPLLYESLYEYAEVLRKQEHYDEAQRFYLYALDEINEVCAPTSRMMEIRAAIYAQESLYLRAIEQLRVYYEMAAHDPDVAATLANTMMDAGFLKYAKKFLYSIEVIDDR